MISRGHLVEDWRGRVGLTLEACDAPDEEDVDDFLERVIGHYGGRVNWWRVALFSGPVVTSPEPGTYSWGPASRIILDWAIKRADRSIAQQLESLHTGKQERTPPVLMTGLLGNEGDCGR